MASRTATYQLSMAFSSFAAGLFYLDHSTIDGPDGLTDSNSYQFDGTYDDVTADADGPLTVTVGTDSLAGAVQASSLEVYMMRATDWGFWNPNNPSSLLNSVTPGFKPMRPVRLQATADAVTYGLFFGFIRRATWNGTSRSCHVYCEDLLLWASRSYPVIASTGSTTTGSAIGLILDAIGWTDPAYRSLATGDVIDDFSADGSQSALQLIAALLEAERGTVFVRGDGVVVYEDRGTPQVRASSGTLHDVLTDIDSATDVDGIYTRVSVTKTGGTAQIATDPDAEQTYGRADLPAIDSPYVVDAAALAGDLIYEKKTPRPPIVATLDNESSAALLLQLNTPLQTIYDIADDLGGTAGTYIVQRAVHTIDAQGFYHHTDWLMLKRPTPTFALDVSNIDGTDDLRY